MHRLLVLWATPRSTSTAFEWMMRMRGDLQCFHEPFGEAWYQGEAPLWPRWTPDSLRTPGLTFDSVREKLKTAAQSGPVFLKDFPHYVEHLWSDEFLSRFEHSFLIRDPAKVLSSLFKHWPDFVIEETGFAQQRRLFDRLRAQRGAAPPVIDSDDLLEDPRAMVASYCNAVGIPFIAEALSWAPGARDEVSWWDGGSFHENLRNSNGLKPQPRGSIDIAAAPDRVREIYATVLPHYRHLYRYRLKPARPCGAE